MLAIIVGLDVSRGSAADLSRSSAWRSGCRTTSSSCARSATSGCRSSTPGSGRSRSQRFETQLNELLGNAPIWTATITAWLAQSGWSIINTLGIFIITPVVAFYLLLDWDSMVKGIDNLLPRDHRVEIRRVLNDIDRSIAAVFRGQGSVILVLCIYYASALSVVGLSFGLADRHHHRAAELHPVRRASSPGSSSRSVSRSSSSGPTG